VTDNFGREISYLRLSVTERCNLRCRYCMPERGIDKKPHSEILTEEEMVMAVRAASGLGIRKLRITGGEPLIKPNIISLCTHLADVEGIKGISITTNGVLLKKYANDLAAAGVSRVNISLDTLDKDKYAYMTRWGRLEDVIGGLEAALAGSFSMVKLNTVLIGGFNDDEIRPLAMLTKKYPVDVRFIELMPMYDGGDFDSGAFITCGKVLEELPELEPVKQDEGVARLFRLPGAYGRVGLIPSLSRGFCSRCSRIRLMADGAIKPCLHDGREYMIKGLDEAGMREVFRQAIASKPEWHGQLSYLHRSNSGRNMNRIGG
jgi:cyclic pyranopterin phosphate synthase